MSLVDWVIAVFLLVSVLSAAKKGFFLEAFSLAGLVLGLMLASWNYTKLLPWVSAWVRPIAVAEMVCFVGIALVVMLVAGLAGRLVRWAVRSVGLGWADRFAGAVFGFLKGCVLITLAVVAMAAFMPQASWLGQSKFVPYFLSAARQTAIVTPEELGKRIRQGVSLIQNVQPGWLKPDEGPAPEHK
ncbi:CvpA family protein [Acidipila rosea]|uniref:Membrane protein required for colicin V production n=1 Tax=Acidipila rosea TaxID=768535 RepID=A0A4R1L0A2_9BACT|nr:CvpA family protein [Acidipila rosea]MBW4026564.1 CvpA family protein [Acidobacteriota bacterium]MBW4044740.1 CvpA family protein [Acidobacteriota bacterium]TCK69719.1 membrane protein required for colicin V production [Acidipila rosea]